MEYSWSYNNGQPSSGSSHGSYVNASHIQQDDPSAFDDAPGFGYPSSQDESDPEDMDFEPHSNHLGFGHSTNDADVDEPNYKMNQAEIDQMSLDFDESDSESDFDIDGPSNHPGVNQSNDKMNQAGIDQMGLDLANADNNNNPGFGHPNNHQGVNEPNFSMNQNHIDNANLPQAATISPSTGSYVHAGKTITQMVKEQTNGEYQGYFTSRQHRKELEEQYMQQQTARMLATIDPASLADLPGDDEVKLREWRRKIIEAIKDCTKVVNKDRTHEKKNKQGEVTQRVTIENTHVRRVRALSLFETEIIADKILETAEKAHQGNTGIAPWAEKSSWVLEKFPTFNDRMVAVLLALRKNKSVAHSFVQVDPALRFVAAPKAEIRGKADNQSSNDTKGELVREGLKAKKAEGKKPTDEQTEIEKAKGR